jgi:hypothetical protein
MIIAAPGLLEYIYCAEHLKIDERRQYEALDGLEFDAHRWAANLYQRPGVKCACIGADGFPLAVAGCLPVRNGVHEVFMLSTPNAWPKYVVQITRAVRKTMQIMLDNHVHRIECISLADRVEAHKWYSLIGLEYEGRVRGWGAKGEDALRFARVKEQFNVYT